MSYICSNYNNNNNNNKNKNNNNNNNYNNNNNNNVSVNSPFYQFRLVADTSTINEFTPATTGKVCIFTHLNFYHKKFLQFHMHVKMHVYYIYVLSHIIKFSID